MTVDRLRLTVGLVWLAVFSWMAVFVLLGLELASKFGHFGPVPTSRSRITLLILLMTAFTSARVGHRLLASVPTNRKVPFGALALVIVTAVIASGLLVGLVLR